MIPSYITCPACSKRIPELADDICVARRDGTERRFYHTRCYDAAEEAILAEGVLRTWTLTYRPAFSERLGEDEEAA